MTSNQARDKSGGLNIEEAYEELGFGAIAYVRRKYTGALEIIDEVEDLVDRIRRKEGDNFI